MLCNFEQILIKIKNQAKVHGHWPNFAKNEKERIIIFSDAYTCELIPIKIRFFYEFLKLLQNWAKKPVLYSTGSLAKFPEK